MPEGRKEPVMANLRQERYDELTVKELNETMTDQEMTEQVQLYYELNPQSQYCRDTNPNLTPHAVLGVDTSCYDN